MTFDQALGAMKANPKRTFARMRKTPLVPYWFTPFYWDGESLCRCWHNHHCSPKARPGHRMQAAEWDTLSLDEVKGLRHPHLDCSFLKDGFLEELQPCPNQNQN